MLLSKSSTLLFISSSGFKWGNVLFWFNAQLPWVDARFPKAVIVAFPPPIEVPAFVLKPKGVVTFCAWVKFPLFPRSVKDPLSTSSNIGTIGPCSQELLPDKAWATSIEVL